VVLQENLRSPAETMAEEEHEDELWIKDDPTQDPSSLRFAPGNLVMYKMDGGWVEGEVLKVCQRLAIPPEFAGPNYDPSAQPPILYIVFPHMDVPEEQHGSHWIHEDTEDHIRPRFDDKTPDPDNFNPVLVAPDDPLEYMYTGVSYDPYDEDGNDMTEAFRNSSLVDSAERNPDGTIELNAGGRRLTTYTMQIPQEPIFGVPGHAIVQCGLQIQRRQPVFGLRITDPVEVFKASVPSERRLADLEAASKTSDKKMLQLGDALMSGVHGWPRDPNRACVCWRAAAWGCQEDEERDRFGIPVGLPEAMVAVVSVLLTYVKREIMGLDLWDNRSTRVIIDEALRSDHGIGVIYQLFFYLSHSIRRGHNSPMTLEIANTVSEMNLARDRRIQDDSDFKDLLKPVLAVAKYRHLEIAFEDLQKTGAVPRGDARNHVITLFGPKANQIFCDMARTSNVVHIEYRQVPRAPFPIVVYAIAPKQKKLIKAVRLPDHLQVSAYTRESFDYAWYRIAFEFHLGDPNTRERKRPSVFTVLDTHGNRQYADYLRTAISGSATEVRLVSYEELIRDSSGSRRRRRQMKLGDILKEIENRLLEIPNYLVDERLASATSTFDAEGHVHQHVSELFEQHESSPHRLSSEAQQFKDQGNQLFTSQDFVGATRCYSILIELVRLLPEPSDESYLLLGTSLSNRAACYLELETQRVSVAFQKLLVQNAIRDCTVALKSSWAARVLPRRILEKLKFRQDKAVAHLDVLETEFQSEIASIIFPQPSRPRAPQQQQNAPPTEHESVATQPTSIAHPASAVDEATAGVASARFDDEGDLLLEKGHVIYDNALAKNSKDGCPICLREFDGELAHVLTSILPCGEHALCAECICSSKKQADKEKKQVACPLCRFQFEGRIVQDLAYHMIETHEGLAGVVEKFPADLDESVEVANKLLWTCDFNVDRVIDTIDKILDDQASGVFFRASIDLTHDQKEAIYRSARLPVNRLEDQLRLLVEERRTTFETARLKSIELEVRKVRSDLASARLKARDEIYEKLNSVGNMGAQNSTVDNVVQVDFHGLHVGEMHSKYKELIQGILPVVKKVRVITGRGLHSTGGESKLMKALKKKIEQDKDTRWDKVPRNPGAIIVSWIKESES